MRVVTVPHYSNGFEEERLEEVEAILPQFLEVYGAARSGKLCVRFTDGDRKGSIARIKPYGDMELEKPCISKRWGRWPNDKNVYQLEHDFLSGTVTWDGRKNSVKFHSFMKGSHDAEFLLDYEGPTVWEKFDAKAAKEELLKNPDQRDINGVLLAVGDSVLYINARYGSRMVLTQGKIVEFLVSVNSSGHTFSTVIESNTGEESNLQYPEDMVYRLS